MKHTSEPWVRVGNSIDGGKHECDEVITVRDLPEYAYPEMQCGTLVGDNLDADLDRIVACVNTCAGINPEAVPMMLKALEFINDSSYDFPAYWFERKDKEGSRVEDDEEGENDVEYIERIIALAKERK